MNTNKGADQILEEARETLRDVRKINEENKKKIDDLLKSLEEEEEFDL